MALGFQDCCNSASYFYLVGIPATVSEFETYYITTSQGENFCATYVDVPALNYLPPTYNLLSMTQFVDCDDCKTSNNYTCPTSETLLINQLTAASVAGSDCGIITIMPLFVECNSTNPTFAGLTNGSVSLYVTGGTPPYFFYSAGTTSAVGNNQSNNNVFPIFQNLPEGTYNVDVTDSNEDFFISISCTLDATPPDLIVSCLPTNVNIYGGNNGVLNLSVNGGTAPYTYTYLGNNVSLPITNLVAGTYTVVVTDSGVGEDQQSVTIDCTVYQPDPINFPDNICMNFTLCGTVFLLQFERDTTDINFRASYVCTNPSLIGLSSLSIYYGDNGWTTSTQNITSQPSFSSPCGISYIGQTFLATCSVPNANTPVATWISGGGALTGVVPIVVSNGICAPTAQFISSETFCLATPTTLANVVVSAYGGTPPYMWNVYNNFVNQTSTSPTFQLISGTYTLVVSDSNGNQSQPISFTVPLESGTDVLFGIDACSDGDVTVSTMNPVDSTPQISPGESRNLLALVNTVIDFSFIPDGAEFTGKLKIILDSVYTSGSANEKFPEPQYITVNPLFAINEITTNGVTTNFLNGVTPVYTEENYPSFNGTNGIWYNFGQGNECCEEPSEQGLKWKQYEYWLTEDLTFNNTTVVSITVGVLTVNAVPFIQGLCADSFCGGYLHNTFSIILQDLNVVSGCLNVDGAKALLSFSVQNNSDGTAGWDNPPIFC